MKIIAISDLHGYLPELPECDLVCICGDIVPLPYQRDLVKSISWFLLSFLPWTDNLKCDKVIFIAGNHDFFLEELGPKHFNDDWEVKERLLTCRRDTSKLIYLCDSYYTYKGNVIYGTPWCPDLKHWAFYGDYKKLNDKFSLIYPNCDILLTHCPPKVKDCGVVLGEESFNTGKNYGCQELTNAITNLRPKWCFCGHVHSGDHDITEFNNTKIVNVSLKNEDYQVAYKPFIFELDEGILY